MKKYIVLAAAAIATLASCTKNEVAAPQAAIEFKAVNHKVTKAAINDATFPTALDFKVSAVYTGTTQWASATTKNSYFNGVSCSYSSAEDLWISSTKAYWPLSGYLTFAAVTPDGTWANDLSKLTVSNFSVGDYAVPTSSITEGQKDLMYTLPQDECDVVNSDMVADNGHASDYVGATDGKYGVKLQFRHALSQIVVYAKAKAGQAGVSFKITELTLTVKDGATIEVTPANFNATTHAEVATPTTFTTAAKAFTGFLQPDVTLASANETSYVTVTKQYNTKDLGVLVIPQALDDNATLKVKYTMQYNSVDAGEKEVTIKLNSGKNSPLTAFAPNKIYKLELELSAEEIKYAPTVLAWDAATTSEYEVK